MSQFEILEFLRSVSPEGRTAKQIQGVLGMGLQSVHSNLSRMRRRVGKDPNLDGFVWEAEAFNGLYVRKYFWREK